MTIKDILDIFQKEGIQYQYSHLNENTNFNRNIKFTINENIYYIQWWSNICYLKIGSDSTAPFFPFNYISLEENIHNSKYEMNILFSNREDLESNNFNSLKIPYNR